jgi:hypothetical protein
MGTSITAVTATAAVREILDVCIPSILPKRCPLGRLGLKLDFELLEKRHDMESPSGQPISFAALVASLV